MSIEVKNLTHIYSEGLPHESKALEDVSFKIDDNEFVGIIGHTGSGKSTLLQHLNGLLRPKSGNILVGDTDITDEKVSMIEIRKKVGLVFQYPEYQLFEETVEKDVAFGPKNLELDDEEIKRRVRDSIELTGLDYEELKDCSPFELSGGQKRRIAIAGVIAMEPKILILDEPTAGLDPEAKEDILKMIEEVHKLTKNITILVSHNMDDVARLADKVLVMDKGKLAIMGTPIEVFSKEEQLKSMGLGVPGVTELMRELFDRGLNVDKNIFTVEAAENEIFKCLTEGK